MANSIAIDVSANTRLLERQLASVNSSLKIIERTTIKTVRTMDRGFNSAAASSFDRVNTGLKATKNSLDVTGKEFESYSKTVILASKTTQDLNNKLNSNTGIQNTNDDLSNLEKSFSAVAFTVGGIFTTSLLESRSASLALSNTSRTLSQIFAKSASTIKDVSTLSKELSSSVLKSSRTFFGFIENISLVGVGLIGIGKILQQSDEQFKRMAGTISLVVGVALAGFSFLIIKLVGSLGSLFQEIGTRGVSAFDSMADSFIKVNKTAVIFTKTVENFNQITGGNVGTIDSWNESVAKTSKTFNFTADSVKKASQEIIAVTSQFGFNEIQMKKTLKIAAEYAAFNQKDLFRTTVNVVSALNGNAQAVTALGIKLNEASVQQFLFKKGSDQTFRSLSDNEKIQARYNKLLSQYKNVAGLGAAAAGTLAGQQKRLEINIKTVNQRLGKGAAIIERNNIAAFVFNKILSTVNESVFTAAGFLGALFSRILQVSGAFIKWSFTIFAALKAFKLLNIFMASEFSNTLLNIPIPLVNKSFTGLIRTLGATSVNLKSVGGAFKTFSSLVKAQSLQIISSILGIEVAAISLSTTIKAILIRSIAGLKIAAVGLGKVLAFLFSPIVIGVAAAVGAVVIMFKAIQDLNRRTTALREIYAVVMELFKETVSVLSPITEGFKSLLTSVKDLAIKGFGVLVVAMSKTFSALASLANSGLASKFLSDDQIQRINLASLKLDNLSDSIVAVGFDMRKMGSDTERAIASANKSISGLNLEKFAELRKELNLVGVTAVQKVERAFKERLTLVNKAISQEIVSTKKGQDLISKLNQDFRNKRIEAIRQDAETERTLREQIKNDQLNKAFQDSQNKINFLLSDFEQTKIIQDQIREQEKQRSQIISSEKFSELEANLGRETALREVEAAQRLAREGKTAQAIARIRKAQADADKKSLASLFSFEQNTNAGRAANFRSTLGTISTLSQQNNSTLFAIGKAAAISQATIDGIAGVQKALASAPPPFNFALAALVGTAAAANVSKIASTKPPPKFQSGGFVGGSSQSGDNQIIRANSGEFVANQAQQRNIIETLASGGGLGGGDDTIDAINDLADAIRNQPIIVQVDNKNIAQAVRNAQDDGFKLRVA